MFLVIRGDVTGCMIVPRHRPVPRVWLAVLLLAGALVGGAGAAGAITSRSEIAAILTRSPAPQLVAHGQELAAAEQAAAGLRNAVAFLGVGDSMQPLYASNTAVVAVPVPFDHIRKGMTVIYVNRDHFRVAHTVVGETTGGYLVQGLGNDEPDGDIVTEKNVIGVVVRAFACSETTFRQEWTVRLRRDHFPYPRKDPV